MQQDSTAPEEWRAVVGYEGWYEVSDHGRVRRVAPGPRTYVGRLMKPQRIGQKPGYWGVQLRRNGQVKTRAVHLLMADAFMPPKPSPLHEINHRDLDSWNNLLTNLEWMTHADNVRHAFQGGAAKSRQGARNANAKLTAADVLAIRRSSTSGIDLARTYNVSPSTISFVRRRMSWQDLA